LFSQIASFSENAIGGTLFAVGKVAKSVAKTADAVVSTELTSKHLKPRELDKRKRPRHAIDGFVQGTQFLGRELVHGTAGLIGSPYRGAKKGKVSSLAKGVATGVGGFVVSPFVAAFGFIAISSEGLGQTTKYLELSEIHARCRPSRVVPWGMPLSSTGLSFLKAIGIRIHTVRYQKIRKAVLLQDQDEGEGDDYVTSKEHKRIRGKTIMYASRWFNIASFDRTLLTHPTTFHLLWQLLRYAELIRLRKFYALVTKKTIGNILRLR
jgi:hypothetical protein